MAAGQQFIKDKGYSSKTTVRPVVICAPQLIHKEIPVDPVCVLMCCTQIQVLPAGSETSLFKQFFIDWRDKDETTGPTKAYTIGRIAKVEQVPFDASSLHSNTTMAAQHAMVDDGKGKVQVRLVSLVVFKVCFDWGGDGESCGQSQCLLASRSGVLRTAPGFQWILPPMVTSMVEIVT